LKEEEIRPRIIFDEYLRLAEIDIITYFKDVKKEHILCPACNSEGEYSFKKSGFKYSLCPNCETLYVSTRPINDAFNRYYKEAPSVEYWATTFYKETYKARRDELWKPKVKLIHETIGRIVDFDQLIVDIGGGYGVFAEEMTALTGNPVTVIEPSSSLAKSCRERGVTVLEKFLGDVRKEDLPAGSKVFVSFELFEHLHNPKMFFEQLKDLMESGDLFIFTTLSGTGIDIQGLWKNSKSVSPPHHLNFFNPRSVSIFLKNVGMLLLEVTTPGKLDIDILSSNQHLIKDRFLKTFVNMATDDEKEQWQQMISETGWSSHMMVCCQKP
jgi:2-polyprenyl-3-methyl-5-hydroxy-6-metoxy-1,4-benzoquinol methylase